MRNNYTEELLDNYNEFYIMTRAVAMLGTQNSELFDRDAQMLIDFCGQVCGWRPELISAAVDLLLGDLMRLGLLTDYAALASAEMLDEVVTSNLILYEIKGMALEEALRSALIFGGQLSNKVAYELQSRMSSHFFHHAYEPRVRYAQLVSRADSGDSVAALQTAMMQILGIGCGITLLKAQKQLERVLLWGGPDAWLAARILAFLWAREDDPEMVSFYETVRQYLNGVVTLPELLRVENAENTKAVRYCVLIAAMRFMTNKSGNPLKMDAVFADLINSEEIPFSDKLTWVCRCGEGTWLKHCVLNREASKIGF